MKSVSAGSYSHKADGRKNGKWISATGAYGQDGHYGHGGKFACLDISNASQK